MNDRYRLVFSHVDGSAPISTTPVDRATALDTFGRYARSREFASGSGHRLRVVREREWETIRARGGRRVP